MLYGWTPYCSYFEFSIWYVMLGNMWYVSFLEIHIILLTFGLHLLLSDECGVNVGIRWISIWSANSFCQSLDASKEWTVRLRDRSHSCLCRSVMSGMAVKLTADTALSTSCRHVIRLWRHAVRLRLHDNGHVLCQTNIDATCVHGTKFLLVSKTSTCDKT